MSPFTRLLCSAAVALCAHGALAQTPPPAPPAPAAPAPTATPQARDRAAIDRQFMLIPIGLRGDGIVIQIDPKAGTLTLDGGMVMKVKSPAVLEGIQPGMRVEYGVEETRAGLVVIAIRSIS